MLNHIEHYLVFLIVFVISFSLFIQYSYAEVFDEHSIQVQTIAKNLKIPWEVAFVPDGRIFVTERIGNIRVIQNESLLEKPLKTFDVSGCEGGLLGIALDPNFETNHYLYVYYTYNDLIFTYNKVVRFTESNNEIFDEKIILDKIPGGLIHDGGRIKFGPDGKMYVLTGDSGRPQLAQDLNSLAGKVLRINPDGTVPNDNPFVDSPVYSYGHRNPQGLDWDPITGKLVITEHGPSGEKGFAHDEVNVIEPRLNYGWPEVVGNQTDARYVLPILQTADETWAPSGATFYNSEKIPQWKNKFLVATLRGNHLRVLDLNVQENTVKSNYPVFAGEFGRLRDATMGPSGDLYLLTSNQDGRGNPVSDDDRILRLVPLSYDSGLSPLKQFKETLDFTKIHCKEGLYLFIKLIDGNPICVKNNTIPKLIQRGIEQSEKTPNLVHLNIVKPKTIAIQKNQTIEIRLSLPAEFVSNIDTSTIDLDSFRDSQTNQTTRPVNNFREGEQIVGVSFKEIPTDKPEAVKALTLVISSNDATKEGMYEFRIMLYNKFNLVDHFGIHVTK